MTEDKSINSKSDETRSLKEDQSQSPEKEKGKVSIFLTSKGLKHSFLDPDHIGIEQISIEPNDLIKIVQALKANGFDYLQCQGGYDEGPGKKLVCFYHLISLEEMLKNDLTAKKDLKLREVRLKVFLDRSGKLIVPSLYKIYKGADWQERETFDMFGINFEGHPHPKRLLMPEDWKGWPLRKDYVQPDFYEMQDAY